VKEHTHTHAHALMPVTLQATSLQRSFTNCNQQLLLLSSYFGTAESQSVHRLKFTMGQMERGENIAVIHYKTNRTQDNCNITNRTTCNSRGGDCIQLCSISKVLYVITITMLNVAHYCTEVSFFNTIPKTP